MGENVRLADLGIDDPLQMPDWVFGERRPILLEFYSAAGGAGLVISEVAMPARLVVWSVGFQRSYGGVTTDYVRIGFVAGQPANDAAMVGCVPLLRGCGVPGAEPRRITFGTYMYFWDFSCRLLVASEGGRLCGSFAGGAGTNVSMKVMVVYSVVPDHVPVAVAKHLGWM
jgi:hypothetical protein